MAETFVIKIKGRYFYEYKNGRVKTAWSLAGAKLFAFHSYEKQKEKLEKVFAQKKLKFEFVNIGEITTKDYE